MAANGTPERAKIVAVLEERGLVQQITESGLPEAAARDQLYVYCGFDPSRPSLQVGNLVPVMILAHFQRQGHRPIIVVGEGTGMIGDISAHGFEVMGCAAVVGPLAWTSILRLTCFCYALRKAPLVGGLLAGALSLVMNARAWVEDKVTPAWVTRDNACVYVTLCRPA